MSISPWAKGPLELIKHSIGHLEDAGDIDKRIALIGFDNATEVCIDIFIRLHPQLRNGYSISKEDKPKYLRSFNSKIGFLEDYIQKKNIKIDISINEILWFHTLRNELYHSGNGMVPELHVLEGARNSCLSVYETLFNIDLYEYFNIVKYSQNEEESIQFLSQNTEMEYLRSFIEFEKEIRHYVGLIGENRRKNVLMNLKRHGNDIGFSQELMKKLLAANKVRTAIVHGDEEYMIPDFDYEEASSTLVEAKKLVEIKIEELKS